MSTDISYRLKKAIDDSGLTLYELQEKTGIPKSAIQRYSSGNTEKLPIDRVKDLAKATGVSAAYLMGWEEEPESNNKTIKFFTDAQSAMKFIIEQPMVAAYGGYDLDSMSEEEIIDFANTVLQLMKVAASQIKK